MTRKKKPHDVTPRPPAKSGRPVFKPISSEQAAAYSLCCKNDIMFITGPAGCAKAQPLSCNVMTPEGPVPMGSLAVGDEICTPDGGVSKVAGVFPQGVKPVYKITFSDGSSTRCCEDHLWKIQYQQEAISVVISTKDLKGIYRAKEIGRAHV